MERQCANACRVAQRLSAHPKVARAYFRQIRPTRRGGHPASVSPKPVRSHLVSFELRGPGREEVFRFMEALKLIVRATSLGDVHSTIPLPRDELPPGDFRPSTANAWGSATTWCVSR